MSACESKAIAQANGQNILLEDMSLDQLIEYFLYLHLKFLRADKWGSWMSEAALDRDRCEWRIREWGKPFCEVTGYFAGYDYPSVAGQASQTDALARERTQGRTPARKGKQ